MRRLNMDSNMSLVEDALRMTPEQRLEQHQPLGHDSRTGKKQESTMPQNDKALLSGSRTEGGIRHHRGVCGVLHGASLSPWIWTFVAGQPRKSPAN